MVDYRGEVRTINDSKAKIFGLNLYTLSDLKLDETYIYVYEVCTVLTEFNSTLSLETFSIALNDRLNSGRFGLPVGFSTGGGEGVSVEKLATN